MWSILALIILCTLLWAGSIWLAIKYGSKKAKLEAVTTELQMRAREQQNANQILDSVRNMSDDTVRDRLQNSGD